MPSHAVHPFLPHYRLGEHLTSDQPLFFLSSRREVMESGFGVVGRGGEERESTSARVVVGNACCACVLAGAVCMLGRSTSYSIRGVIHMSMYVVAM